MRDYEMMVIFHPELDTPGLQAAFDTLKDKLASLGELTEADLLGRRRLAYEVRKCHQGTYGLLNFTCDPAQLADLRRFLQIEQHEQVIRYLLLIDEKRGTRPPSQPLPGTEEEASSEQELSERDRLAQAAAERAALEEQARQVVEEVTSGAEVEAPVAEEPAPAAEESGAAESE